jgi:opacity protein-like surface antigen
MKRIFGLVIGVLILLFAAQVWAQGRPQNMYLSGNIGFGMRPDADIAGPSGNVFDNDPAFVINGAIGVELNPMWRVEGEIGWHFNAADVAGFPQDFTFGVISFMGNGYFDIPTNSPLRPYLGAGLGFALVGVEEDFFGLTDSDSDLVGAFQLMAGLGYEISPKATLTFGYRYFTTTDPTFTLFTSGPFETEYASHEFLLGARFRF